jgi:hypothetical protein
VTDPELRPFLGFTDLSVNEFQGIVVAIFANSSTVIVPMGRRDGLVGHDFFNYK